jgi:hypothetical protein
VRHLDRDVPIVATIFDPETGRELEDLIGNCTITSLADIVAPTLAGPCLSDDALRGSTATGRSGCAAATARSRDGQLPRCAGPPRPRARDRRRASRSTAARRWSSSARSA